MNKPNPTRLKRLEMYPYVISDLLISGGSFRFDSTLPSDTVLINSTYDIRNNKFVLILSSGMWAEVGPEDAIPMLPFDCVRIVREG